MIVGKFELIHSVDSLELAQAIDRKAAELGVEQKILLQLNLAQEATKGGFGENEFSDLVPQLSQLKTARVVGLMTMPPLFENPEEARPFFKKLFHISHRFSAALPNLKILSMGTSSDYLVAAEEGASLVRLGTILFGERPTKTK
jgi:pyridoxal phosphate enzyme (YggS family)